MISRFALNLPDYVSATQRWREPSCEWEIFEDASPFGSEERHVFHAGRGICEGQLRHSDGRLDRRQRDARLRRAAVHHGAQSVQRADSPAGCPAAGRDGGPLGAVCRVWMGTRLAVLVEHAGVAAGRNSSWRHRTVAASLLDDDDRWRAKLLDLHPERPRRNLRDWVPGDHAHSITSSTLRSSRRLSASPT